MNLGRDTFQKTERLCSRKIISDLFTDGHIIYTTAFKAVWLISPATLPWPAQAAFSVSKKIFRKAVTRNLIKRRMREAYRKMKIHLYNFLNAENIQICLIIIYTGEKIPDYLTIEKKMKELLDKLLSGVR